MLNEGDGAFYGPKIDLHMTDVLGRSWQMGTIQLDSQMPQRFGLTYIGRRQPRAHAVRDSPRAARVARAVHGHPDRALRRRVPVWLAPVQVRVRPGRRGPPRGGAADSRRAARARRPRRRRRTRRDASASGSATRSSRRSRTCVVYGDKESDDGTLAVRERGGGQSTKSLFGAFDASTCYAVTLQAGAISSSPPAAGASRRPGLGGSTEHG